MRKTIRLSGETEMYLYALRRLYESRISDIRLFKANVINKAYKETEEYSNEEWYGIANSNFKISPELLDGRTDFEASNNKLNLTVETVEGINTMLKELPDVFGANWVTMGFCIKLMVKGALIKNCSVNQ